MLTFLHAVINSLILLHFMKHDQHEHRTQKSTAHYSLDGSGVLVSLSPEPVEQLVVPSRPA